MNTSHSFCRDTLALGVAGCIALGGLIANAQVPKPAAPPPAPAKPPPSPQTPVNPQVPVNPAPAQPPGNPNPGAVPQTPGAVPPTVGAVPPGAPAVPGPAQPGVPPTTVTRPTVITPSSFVGGVAMSDLREARLAQLAQQRSQNPAVQRFAQDMITQQTAANQRMAEFARSQNIVLPPANTFDAATLANNPNLRNQDIQPNQPIRNPNLPDSAGTRVPVRDVDPFTVSQADRELLARLETLSGPEFDQAFMNAIVEGRAQTLHNFDAASQSLQDAQMRRFIGERVPTLRESQATALRLNQTLGTPRNAVPPAVQPRQPIRQQP